ncbi:hypothetical protein BJV82DRAFT_607718 [Fennellomyces sp. T-0311]|nr:hypothetical protein BJV82DRAFT_607718 [Fennellomyces sp. T-0311]
MMISFLVWWSDCSVNAARASVDGVLIVGYVPSKPLPNTFKGSKFVFTMQPLSCMVCLLMALDLEVRLSRLFQYS